jgi:hypothetical protein
MLPLCPRCHRHVHADATACPFCTTALALAGAMLAAVSAMGCGAYGPAPRDSVNNPRVPDPGPAPAPTDSSQQNVLAPAYGPPPGDPGPSGAYGPAPR